MLQPRLHRDAQAPLRMQGLRLLQRQEGSQRKRGLIDTQAEIKGSLRERFLFIFLFLRKYYCNFANNVV